MRETNLTKHTNTQTHSTMNNYLPYVSFSSLVNPDYVDFVVEFTQTNLTLEELIRSFGVGLVGEAGELADAFKKLRYTKRPVEQDALLLELGDLWFYATGLWVLFNKPRVVDIYVPETIEHSDDDMLLHLVRLSNACSSMLGAILEPQADLLRIRLSSVIRTLFNVMLYLDYTIEDVEQANMAKLKARQANSRH